VAPKKVVRLLVPLDLLEGKVPTLEYLRQYDLEDEYGNLCTACLEGDLRLFDHVQETKFKAFVDSGVFLVV
jgi:hypothetical protein